MIYTGFIALLKQVQTERVKAISLPNSCAVSQIPNAFSILFKNLVRFMDSNIYNFCHDNQVMALFGLQVTAGGIQSELPQTLGRVRYRQYSDCHFCCVLNYLVFPEGDVKVPDTWRNYQSVVIDFTTGKIMDNNHYVFLTTHRGEEGKVYGELNQSLLKKSWKLFNKELISQKKTNNTVRLQDEFCLVH